MVAVGYRGRGYIPENSINKGVPCTSVCKCYSLTQSDVQALENEVKSMSETIKILKDELKYECANKGARKPTLTYAEKLKSGINACSDCAELESQLQTVLD